MACQPTEAGIIRSGYCAVRTPMPTGVFLHGYEGITMRIMTDGREYRMNAQMDSWNPLNLYMVRFMKREQVLTSGSGLTRAVVCCL